MKALLTLVGLLSLLVFATACSKQEEPVSPADEISAAQTEQAPQDSMEVVEESADEIEGLMDDADESAEAMLQEAEDAVDQEAPVQE